MNGPTRPSGAGRAWAITGAITAALVGGVVSAAWLGQRSIMYFPETADPGSAVTGVRDGSDVVLHTDDGLTIGAWQVQPRNSVKPAVAAKGPAPVVRDAKPAAGRALLYLPGNAGNRAGRAGIGEHLASQGFTVLLLDYRGFGGNPGSPTEEGLIADARAGYQHLIGLGFVPEDIVVFGESLGTGVATQLARTVPVRALLLRSPFTRMDDAARHMLKIPVRWLLLDHYDSLAAIAAIDAPVTILAGSADDVVPVAQSRRLAAATPNLYEYVELRGIGHSDDVWFGPFAASKASALAH